MAKRKNCGKMTWSAATASKHDKNRNGSLLVSVDPITPIYMRSCLSLPPASALLL